MSIDPIVLTVAFALAMLLLSTAWLMRERSGRRRRRPMPGTEVYCSCGARAEVGTQCARCAWNRGRV